MCPTIIDHLLYTSGWPQQTLLVPGFINTKTTKCVSLSLQLTERINEIKTAMITAVEESGGAHTGLEGTIMSRINLHGTLIVNKFINSRWGCSLRLIIGHMITINRIHSQISIANYKAAAK